MRWWIQVLLTGIGFLSVLGLIGLQIHTGTTFVSPDRPVSREERPALYWTVIGLQLLLVAASVLLMAAQVMLGM